MNTIETRHYVTYLFPGFFFPEMDTRQVNDRDAQRMADEAPEGAFAFEFFSKLITTGTTDGGERITLSSAPVNESGRYYIDATTFTYAQVEMLPGDNKILLANMRGNGWPLMVRCRTGNWQPLTSRDRVVSTRTERKELAS